MPKSVIFLQILLKVYIKRQISPSADLVSERSAGKISGSNSLQSLSNLAQKRSSGAANC